jgi:hypothetical protein
MPIPLGPGEVVKWSRAVNRITKSGRRASGRLTLTNQRVLFVPVRIESALGVHPWIVPLDVVSAVAIVPPDAAPANIRKLLRLHLSNGGDEFFGFNHKRSALDVFASAIGQTSSSPLLPDVVVRSKLGTAFPWFVVAAVVYFGVIMAQTGNAGADLLFALGLAWLSAFGLMKVGRALRRS